MTSTISSNITPLVPITAPPVSNKPPQKPGVATFQTFIQPNARNSLLYPVNNSNWVSNPTLLSAIQSLEEVSFNPYDVMHLENMGARIRFKSGKEAVDFLKRRNVSIVFAPVDNPKIHAQWTKARNTVTINEKYRHTTNLAEILAISEAIFHEAGHALDDDYGTSIQEEIDCLALNTLANRFHQAKYPNVFTSRQNSDILDDGVCLYTALFFDPDITKKALVRRISEKYGELPVESPHHSVKILALKTKEYYLNG